MEEELAQLTAEKKKVSEDIKTALGFGDLSENAEYHEAKENEGQRYQGSNVSDNNRKPHVKHGQEMTCIRVFKQSFSY